jgi:hypothetical protein
MIAKADGRSTPMVCDDCGRTVLGFSGWRRHQASCPERRAGLTPDECRRRGPGADHCEHYHAGGACCHCSIGDRARAAARGGARDERRR